MCTLQAVFVGAVVPQDQRAIVQLVKKVIVCLACASSDDQHSGVRYARLLNGLLRVFSKGVDGVASQIATPKRRSQDFSSKATINTKKNAPESRTADQTGEDPVPSTKSMENSVFERTATSQPSSASSTGHEGQKVPSPPRSADAPSFPTASHHVMRSPGTEAVLAHLPMPRLDANASLWRRGSHHYLHPSSVQPRSAAHQPHAILTNPLFNGRAESHSSHISEGNFTSNELANEAYSHHQPHMIQDHQEATLLHGHQHTIYSAANGYSSSSEPISQLDLSPPQSANAPNPGAPYEVYCAHSVPAPPSSAATTSPSGSLTGIPIGNASQFDLNWPPTEVDGLTQVLVDDHAVDGDFWMSLPRLGGTWQNWPQAANGNGAAAGHVHRRMSEGVGGGTGTAHHR
jgi:hypothetical protein